MSGNRIKLMFLAVISIAIGYGLCFLTISFFKWKFHTGGVPAKTDYALSKQFAEELLNKRLYKLAIVEYERFLQDPSLGSQRLSNLYNLIGNIYMENLRDYENAMANFLKSKTLLPEAVDKTELNKKIIECLERLGRSTEASVEMARLTALKPETIEAGSGKGAGKQIVARIGERKISMEELENEIQGLPTYLKQQYKDSKKRLEFLNQYVASEILFNLGQRKGLDRDKEIMDSISRVKKQLMISKVLEEEVSSKIKPAENDLKLFYRANRRNYHLPFKRIKERVEFEYTQKRQQEEINSLINRLMGSEDVKIYTDVFE